MAEIAEGPDKGEKKTKPKKHSTKIDMTPMVDLAFLLLTFFMLTNTFNKPQTMEINMPAKPKTEEKEQPVPASKTVTLILGKDDKIYWFHGEVDKTKMEVTNFGKDGVRKILMDKNAAIRDAKGEPELVVLIKPKDDSKYKNVVDILDEMNITDIKRYAIVEVQPIDLEQLKLQLNVE